MCIRDSVQFFWYAPHVHASASHVAIFRNCNPGPKLGSHAGRPDPARTGADHKKVVVMLFHRYFPRHSESQVYQLGSAAGSVELPPPFQRCKDARFFAISIAFHKLGQRLEIG